MNCRSEGGAVRVSLWDDSGADISLRPPPQRRRSSSSRSSSSHHPPTLAHVLPCRAPPIAPPLVCCAIECHDVTPPFCPEFTVVFASHHGRQQGSRVRAPVPR